MKVIQADIWRYWAVPNNRIVVISTNGWVNKDGNAATDRGLFRQAAKLFKGLTIAVANLIRENGNQVFYLKNQRLIMFPTKDYWKDKASLELIDKSCEQLKKLMDTDQTINVAMPKVGCGWGKLDWRDVKPLIEYYFGSYSADRFIIVDNEQGATFDWKGDNEANERNLGASGLMFAE